MPLSANSELVKNGQWTETSAASLARERKSEKNKVILLHQIHSSPQESANTPAAKQTELHRPNKLFVLWYNFSNIFQFHFHSTLIDLFFSFHVTPFFFAAAAPFNLIILFSPSQSSTRHPPSKVAAAWLTDYHRELHRNVGDGKFENENLLRGGGRVEAQPAAHCSDEIYLFLI